MISEIKLINCSNILKMFDVNVCKKKKNKTKLDAVKLFKEDTDYNKIFFKSILLVNLYY